MVPGVKPSVSDGALISEMCIKKPLIEAVPWSAHHHDFYNDGEVSFDLPLDLVSNLDYFFLLRC